MSFYLHTLEGPNWSAETEQISGLRMLYTINLYYLVACPALVFCISSAEFLSMPFLVTRGVLKTNTCAGYHQLDLWFINSQRELSKSTVFVGGLLCERCYCKELLGSQWFSTVKFSQIMFIKFSEEAPYYMWWHVIQWIADKFVI